MNQAIICVHPNAQVFLSKVMGDLENSVYYYRISAIGRQRASNEESLS